MTEGLVLFSGGIDSTTSLYWARNKFDRTQAVSFRYGQRHEIETQLAVRVTERLEIPHKIICLDLTQIGGSALTDPGIEVPKLSSLQDIGTGPPSTYVPFRNGILLALAAAWGEINQIRHLVTGFNIVDSPNYPDTRSEFLKAMETAVNLGTTAAFDRKKFVFHAPYINYKKSQIILEGLAMGADYSNSISCYTGKEVPCGECSSCLIRRSAWEEAGVEDHLIERLKKEGKI